MLFSALLFMIAFIQLTPADLDTLTVLSDSMYVDGGSIVNLGATSSWRFSPGDDIRWADPGFDHSGWVKQRPSGITEPLPSPLWDEGYGWFRTYFLADSSIYHNPWYFYFYTWGAAEVYIDGELVHSYGHFSTTPEDEVRYNPISGKLYPAFSVAPRDTHLVAVRLSYHPAQKYQNLLGDNSANFGFGIGLVKQDRNDEMNLGMDIAKIVSFTAIGVLFIITLLHGFLFYLFRDQKANMLIAIITGLLLLHSFAAFNQIHFPWLDHFWQFVIGEYSFSTMFIGAVLLLPYTIVLLFNLQKYEKSKHLIWLVIPVFFSHLFYFRSVGISIIAVGAVVLVLSVFLLYQARKMNKKGVGFVSFGFVGIILVAATIITYQEVSDNVEWAVEATLVLLLYIIIPLSMTLFMAFKMANLYTGLEDIVETRTAALKRSLEELKAAQTQLVQQEKLASLGQLTAGIAHEIKNPLNFVNNFSELSVELIEEAREEVRRGTVDGGAGSEKGEVKGLKSLRQPTEESDPAADGELGDDAISSNYDNPSLLLDLLDDIEANLKTIHKHGSRADSIVKSMLQHSRGGDGTMEPTPINPLIKEYVNLSFHGMRAGKEPINVDIELDLDESIGEVPLIAEDFSRVILNLVNNAFDAMREKAKVTGDERPGTEENSPLEGSAEAERRRGVSGYAPKLSIRTKSLANTITIEIEDNGPGIPDNMKDKILQPFFTTKKGTEGTGLGLSITNDIVKAHGGQLSIQSNSEGTTFIITLPV